MKKMTFALVWPRRAVLGYQAVFALVWPRRAVLTTYLLLWTLRWHMTMSDSRDRLWISTHCSLSQHEWLHFEPGSAAAMRCRRIIRMSMGTSRCIDWGVLGDCGEVERCAIPFIPPAISISINNRLTLSDELHPLVTSCRSIL
ncbi:hypothetical protein R6Q57_001336 [Mikania cordata]